MEVGECCSYHGSHHTALIRLFLARITSSKVSIMRQTEDVTKFMSKDEGTGETLISVETAAPVRITDSRHRSITTGSSNVKSGDPHCHIMSLFFGKIVQNISVPGVDILKRDCRVVLKNLTD